MKVYTIPNIEMLMVNLGKLTSSEVKHSPARKRKESLVEITRQEAMGKKGKRQDNQKILIVFRANKKLLPPVLVKLGIWSA